MPFSTTEEAVEELQNLPLLAQVSGGCVELFDPEQEEFVYDIDLTRCDTPEKILSWVQHLSDKSWVSPRTLSGFVANACAYHNIILPET